MTTKLLPHHEKVLRALDRETYPWGEYCVGFKRLSRSLRMPRDEVRRIVRHLARRGYAEFHRALVNESTWEFAGAGYCISEAGRAAIRKPV